jgi:hypothetical protein
MCDHVRRSDVVLDPANPNPGRDALWAVVRMALLTEMSTAGDSLVTVLMTLLLRWPVSRVGWVCVEQGCVGRWTVFNMK